MKGKLHFNYSIKFDTKRNIEEDRLLQKEIQDLLYERRKSLHNWLKLIEGILLISLAIESNDDHDASSQYFK